MTGVDPAQEPVWLFIHVPKTGGTTFMAHLERHLTWDEELVEFSNWGRTYRRANHRLEFSLRAPEARACARVLAGHDLSYGAHRLVPGREGRYVTFLRHPAERCVSLYNFRRSRGVTALGFEEWFVDRFLPDSRNSLVDFLAARVLPTRMLCDPLARWDAACALLRKCWHVGLTEELDASLALLCREIGVPADWTNQRAAGSGNALVSPSHPDSGEVIERHFELDEMARERISKVLARDMQLYNWVREGMPGSPRSVRS